MGAVAVEVMFVVVLGLLAWRMSVATSPLRRRATRVLDVLGLGDWPPASVFDGETSGLVDGWVDARLVMASREDATLVLDCVVYAADPRGVVDSPPAMLTLRAHPRADLTPPSIVGPVVSEWVSSGAAVGLRVRVEGGLPVLRIADESVGVALQLDDSL
jgi:hypothetical protein